MKCSIIIPFRLLSKRFPSKVLCRFKGRTLLEHTIRISARINGEETVLTCPDEDYNAVASEIDLQQYKHRYIPSGRECLCATDRVLQIYPQCRGDLIISMPIDEPMLDPEEVNRVLREIEDEQPEACTLWCDFFCLDDALSHLSAKIVTNNRDEVLYMSRAVIPVSKNGNIELSYLKKNVGVFFFRRTFLHELAKYRNRTTLYETFEGLEQLRWLQSGFKLKTKKITHYGFGIDTPQQVRELEKRMECLPGQKK